MLRTIKGKSWWNYSLHKKRMGDREHNNSDENNGFRIIKNKTQPL